MSHPTNTKHFSSDMPNAPTVYADAGGCVGWLDTLLVTGYGLIPILTITVTDGTAVADMGQGHSLRKWMVALHESTGNAGLNGEFRVILASGNTYTFEVAGVPNGVYTGGTTKVAPLGFEITYTGTNTRIYRSLNVSQRNAVSLYVDDTNTAVGWNIGTNKALAQVKMVSDVVSINSYVTLATAWWFKSAAVSGVVARPWNLMGDTLGFYTAVDVASNGVAVASNHFMQLNSRAIGDMYATMLEGATPTTGVTSTVNPGALGSQGGNMSAMDAGSRVIARNLNQLGVSLPVRYMGLGALSNLNYTPFEWLTSGNHSGVNPAQLMALAAVNPSDSGVVFGQNIIAAHSPTGATDGTDFTGRATMPGMFSVPSILSWSMVPTVIEEPAGLVGVVLASLPAVVGSSSGYVLRIGGYYIDVTGNWR